MKRLFYIIAAGMLLLNTPASAAELVGLTGNNALIHLDTSDPSVTLGTVNITGLQTGDNIVTIDFNPHTGQLIGLGSSKLFYAIDAATGATSLVGSKPLKKSIDNNTVSLEIDPVIGDIQVLDGTGLNLLVDTITGLLNLVLGKLLYLLGDTNFGTTPNIIQSAFDNFDTAGGSILYVIDGATGSLAKVIDGILVDVLQTVAGIQGVDVSKIIGFDIDETGLVILATLLANGEGTEIHILNLITGITTLLGDTVNNLIDVVIVPGTVSDGDTDGDGVPNELDRCPNTETDAVVDNNGCSTEQLCPCEGPRTGGVYKKIGYRKCVRQHSKRMKKQGVITKAERKVLVQAAKLPQTCSP